MTTPTRLGDMFRFFHQIGLDDDSSGEDHPMPHVFFSRLFFKLFPDDPIRYDYYAEYGMRQHSAVLQIVKLLNNFPLSSYVTKDGIRPRDPSDDDSDDDLVDENHPDFRKSRILESCITEIIERKHLNELIYLQVIYYMLYAVIYTQPELYQQSDQITLTTNVAPLSWLDTQTLKYILNEAFIPVKITNGPSWRR